MTRPAKGRVCVWVRTVACAGWLAACGDFGETGGQIFDPADPEAPIIEALHASSFQVDTRGEVHLEVVARDPQGQALAYEWRASAGHFAGATDGPVADWEAPGRGGDVILGVQVRNAAGKGTTREITIVVVSSDLPVVTFERPRSGEAVPALGVLVVTATAEHPNGIERVEFQLDGVPVHEDLAGPDFTWPWDVSGISGPFSIQARAWSPLAPDKPGIAAVQVYVESVVVP